jgi:hypothetical protein
VIPKESGRFLATGCEVEILIGRLAALDLVAHTCNIWWKRQFVPTLLHRLQWPSALAISRFLPIQMPRDHARLRRRLIRFRDTGKVYRRAVEVALQLLGSLVNRRTRRSTHSQCIAKFDGYLSGKAPGPPQSVVQAFGKT